MDLTLTYTNHLGETVEIANGGNLHLLEGSWLDHEWSYDVLGQSVRSLRVCAREISLPIGMFGGSLAERTRTYRVLEADVACSAQGTLRFHGFELSVIPVATTLGAWWFSDGIEERKVTFLARRPYWTRDVLTSFPVPTTPEDEWLDLPTDLPMDLGRPPEARGLVVDTIGPTEWRWVVHGPARNPWVSIAGNRHAVDVVVPTGGSLVLDTRDRTCVLIGPDGVERNVFSKRVRGADGSGTYCMARLPMGALDVSAGAGFAFDIIVHDERTEPAWE